MLINPQIVGGIRHAQATYDSPYGQILSRWQKHLDGSLTLEVRIPANAIAQVVLPVAEVSECAGTKDAIVKITEHGVPIAQCEDICLTTENQQTIAHIGSGHYLFSIKK